MARAQTAAGEGRPRVVLFAPTVDDPLAGRLAAELESMGLSVSRATLIPTAETEDLVRTALAEGARAAVVADGSRTEFWIAEEGSNRVALRQELEIESSPDLESVLSLRTVEFLRVSLGLASHADSGAPGRRPAEVVVPAEPSRPDVEKRFSLALTSGMLASTGPLDPFVVVGVALRARIAGPLGLELRGYAPLGRALLQPPEGEIETSVWLAGGGLLLAPSARRGLSVEAGLGMMAAVVTSAGTAVLSGDRLRDYAVGLAYYGRGALRLRLAAGWSLRLDLLGGSTSQRRPVIAVLSVDGTSARDLAPWGTLFGAALGGLEVYF